jgi:hypothetical protein
MEPPERARPAFAPRAFRAPIVDPETAIQEVPSVSFGDLVRMVAEGIADAQASLDRASAELVRELANTKVTIVPRITETIDENGDITYQHGEPQEVSLLDIGVTPTFYQFSQATVEVRMDLKIVESSTTTETTETKRRHVVYADTSSVRAERKLNRDVTMSSKLTATLVPVPSPLRLEPTRTTRTAE